MIKGTLIGTFDVSGGRGLAEIASKISTEKTKIIWVGMEGSEYVARSLRQEDVPKNLFPVTDISTDIGAVGEALSTAASLIRDRVNIGSVFKYRGGTKLSIYEVFRVEKGD